MTVDEMEQIEIDNFEYEPYRREPVRVKCHICHDEHDNELEFGTNLKYPEDFFIRCKQCGAAEEGSLPVRSFDVMDLPTKTKKEGMNDE